MTRLKVHHMREGGLTHEAIAVKTGISVRSVERILNEEDRPGPEDLRAGALLGRRRPGRPSKVAAYRDRVIALLAEEPRLPDVEVYRRARLWGYTGGRSAMLSLVKDVRPPKVKEPIVRFEGLPGEFAQFDCGEGHVRFLDGRRRKVRFFVGRLKYSRYLHVELTEDQKAERLVRSLIACLEAFGGAPKEWVFDNPRTIRFSKIGVEPVVFHPYIRDLAADFNILPTLCAPRAGNQKGSVERGVGFVKHSFLFARKFQDMDHLQRELTRWLHEVNHERPSDATGVIPAVALQREQPWLDKRPVRVSAAGWPLRESATISPTATILWRGTSYGAPPKRIGATATVLIRASTVEVVIDDDHQVHRREDGSNRIIRSREDRREFLAVIHGQRKKNYFRRQCLLELGPATHDFLEQLIHRSVGGSWSPVVHELFELLQEHGADAMRRALAVCHLAGRYDDASVAGELRRAA